MTEKLYSIKMTEEEIVSVREVLHHESFNKKKWANDTISDITKVKNKLYKVL